MNITISGHHVELTQGMKDHVTKQFNHSFEHYVDTISSIKVTLDIEKELHIAEATVHVKGHDLHAKSTSHDMYQSIDELAAKVLIQLKKDHDKKATHHEEPVKKNPIA